MYLYNTGLPTYLAAYLAGAGVPGLGSRGLTHVTGKSLLSRLAVGGQTQVRGNQARLDLTRRGSEIALANILIVSLDDTVIAGNQTKACSSASAARAATTSAIFQGDLTFTDLLNLAVTTRQSHNGFLTTPS